MTYCNQEIPDKDRRKRKQPSVSLWALDRERRAAEIEEYQKNPHKPMPIMIPIESGCTIRWPNKFR